MRAGLPYTSTVRFALELLVARRQLSRLRRLPISFGKLRPPSPCNAVGLRHAALALSIAK